MLKQIKHFYTPSSGSRIYGVLSSHIDDVWNQVEPLLSKSLDYADGKYSTGSIYKALKVRDMQLWVSMRGGLEACCVTEIRFFPLKKVCTVMFCAGKDMDNWLWFLSEVELWAISNGCHSIEVHGRRGWEKILGWELISTVIRKNL